MTDQSPTQQALSKLLGSVDQQELDLFTRELLGHGLLPKVVALLLLRESKRGALHPVAVTLRTGPEIARQEDDG